VGQIVHEAEVHKSRDQLYEPVVLEPPPIGGRECSGPIRLTMDLIDSMKPEERTEAIEAYRSLLIQWIRGGQSIRDMVNIMGNSDRNASPIKWILDTRTELDISSGSLFTKFTSELANQTRNASDYSASDPFKSLPAIPLSRILQVIAPSATVADGSAGNEGRDAKPNKEGSAWKLKVQAWADQSMLVVDTAV